LEATLLFCVATLLDGQLVQEEEASKPAARAMKTQSMNAIHTRQWRSANKADPLASISRYNSHSQLDKYMIWMK